MNIIFIKKPYLSLAYVSLFNIGGPIIETNNEKGYTHFLEHLIYRQNTIPPNPYYYDNLGGSYELATFKELFFMKMEFPLEKINSAFTYFLDNIYNLKLTPELVEEEKKMVMDEISAHYGKINIILMENLLKHLYPSSYLSEQIGGNQDTIMEISMDKLSDFRDKFVSIFYPTVVIIASDNPLESKIENKIDIRASVLKTPLPISTGGKKIIHISGIRSYFLVGVAIRGGGKLKILPINLLKNLFKFSRSLAIQKYVHNELGIYNLKLESKFYNKNGVMSFIGNCDDSKVDFITTLLENFFRDIGSNISEKEFKQAKEIYLYEILHQTDHPAKLSLVAAECFFYKQELLTIEDVIGYTYRSFIRDIHEAILTLPYTILAIPRERRMG